MTQTAERGAISFRIYPETPGDVFAPSAADGLPGTQTRLDGRPVTITAAEPTGDGGLLLTVGAYPAAETCTCPPEWIRVGGGCMCPDSRASEES